jgi:vancomycin permeability regulator SanA
LRIAEMPAFTIQFRTDPIGEGNSMRRASRWLVYLGDLALLESFSFFYFTRTYDTGHQALYLALACVPIFIVWTVGGLLLRAFDLNRGFRAFLARPWFLWPAAFAIHQAAYWIAFNALNREIAAARMGLWLLTPLAAGFILLAAWRSVFFLLYRAVRSAKLFVRRSARAGLVLLAGALVVFCIPRLADRAQAAGQIYPPQTVPARPVALVFGAGFYGNGDPSAILSDRVVMASRLFQAGKVQRLLLTGSGHDRAGSEVTVMQRLALANGVPASAIGLDDAGDDTYASCARAAQVYHIQQAILVTQAFHMDRALYLCNHLGVESVGVTADLSPHSLPSLALWNLREIPASFLAWMKEKDEG